MCGYVRLEVFSNIYTDYCQTFHLLPWNTVVYFNWLLKASDSSNTESLFCAMHGVRMRSCGKMVFEKCQIKVRLFPVDGSWTWQSRQLMVLTAPTVQTTATVLTRLKGFPRSGNRMVGTELLSCHHLRRPRAVQRTGPYKQQDGHTEVTHTDVCSVRGSCLWLSGKVRLGDTD